MGSLPIIPVPGGMVGVNQFDPSHSGGFANRFISKFKEETRHASNENVARLLGEHSDRGKDLYGSERSRINTREVSAASNLTDPQITEYITQLGDKNRGSTYTTTAATGTALKRPEQLDIEFNKMIQNPKVLERILASTNIADSTLKDGAIEELKNFKDKDKLQNILNSIPNGDKARTHTKLEKYRRKFDGEEWEIDDNLALKKVQAAPTP